MADMTPSDNVRPVSFVNRRRVLLAVGGMALTSVPARSLGLAGPDDPARAQTLTRHRDAPHHRRHSGAVEEPLFYVNDGPKTIALTIDDGPNPIYTPQVLRLLHKYHVTATFSMIGINVAAYPSLAREVAAAGHRITNHTWNHEDLVRMPARRVHGELERASHAIHQATGLRPALFRAPYGAWSRTVLRECEQMGMTPVDWSVDPRDWAMPGVRSIVRNIMRNTRPGSIILEHDGGGNRSQTVAALRIVLPRLLHEGYQFAPL